jgi:N-acetylglutamate synthase-like GNAT family acetyltransferase
MTGEKQGEAPALRRATIDDAPAIRALTREAYAKWVPLIGREPLPMLADYAEAAQQHRIDLLHLAGKLAALIEMIPQTGHLLIENVAVAPALQRRGLGGKLLAHAEEGGRVARLRRNQALHQRALRRECAALPQARLPDRPEGGVQRKHAGAHEQTARQPERAYLLHVAMMVEPLSTDH